MIERISFEAGKPQFFGETKITVISEAKAPKIIPSEVARHESTHAVLALANGTEVSSITIQPSSDYHGLTELSKFDAVAALGPHSVGASGTGYDVSLVERMGYDVGALSKAARGMINNNLTAIEAVAELLEERGTLSGSEAKQAINSAGKPKDEKVKVIIENSAGEVEEFSDLESKGGVVMLPDVFYSLSDDKLEDFEEELEIAA